MGQRRTFWLWDGANRTYFAAALELRFSSPHFHYWFPPTEAASGIEDKASAVESTIWPAVLKSTGVRLDGDWHVSIVNSPMPEGGGFFSAIDFYPAAVNPYSNQIACVYVNSQAVPLSSADYLATLAHELHHLAVREVDPTRDTWIKEGQATQVQAQFGDTAPLTSAFLQHPDVQLNAWDDYGPNATARYGATLLYTAEVGRELDDAGFQQWEVANLTQRHAQAEELVGTTLSGVVSQMGARYIQLPKGTSQVNFAGAPSVPVIPLDGESAVWWSGTGDWSDSKLTLPLAVPPAGGPSVITYRLWFNLQRDLDHGYVEVSPDGGRRWRLLGTQHTTEVNPAGNSYGPAYTGQSAGWVDEAVDLGAYQGQRVLLRFEVVTDDFIHWQGLAVHGIRFANGPPLDVAGAEADGFRRVGSVAQRYLFGVVLSGEPPRFIQPALGSPPRASVSLPPGDRAVAVVAGLSAETRTQATFLLSAS